MSEVIISAEKYIRLKTALGYFMNAEAYRSTFPDNDEDAAQLRKSATWNEITGRNFLTDKDQFECSEAMKKHVSEQPEFKKTMDDLATKLSKQP